MARNRRSFRLSILDFTNQALVALMGAGHSNAEILKIVPVVAGAGRGGKALFGVIAGVALIALGGPSGFVQGLAWQAGATAGLAATIGSAAASLGWALALGGVASLFVRSPKYDSLSAERPENRPSYAFNGPVNRTAQGVPVPLCYGGPILVGSQVISSGLRTEQIAP
jgi:predicted phage tail protein